MTALRTRHELLEVLVEQQDPRLRARAHLELSWLAVKANRRDAAIRHLREALELDEHLQQARRRLKELGGLREIEPVLPRSMRQRVGNRLAGLFKA